MTKRLLRRISRNRERAERVLQEFALMEVEALECMARKRRERQLAKLKPAA